MNKFIRFFRNITFSQAVLLSISVHCISVLLVFVFPYFIIQKEDDLEAIQVAVIGNFKDLPSLRKKDAKLAVETAKGKTKKLSLRSPKKDEMAYVNKNRRANIIERLKRIKKLKENQKDKGQKKGLTGIQGTTLAQSKSTGTENWYISRKFKYKVTQNYYLAPNFHGDSPDLLVTYRIKLNSDGSINQIKLLKSSGNTFYDNQTYKAIVDAAPFGEVPDKYKKIFLERGFDVRFPRMSFE